MEYLRNLKANTARVAKMKLQVDKYWKFISWKNNAVCQDINEATRAVEMNLDCGSEKMTQFLPKNNCLNSWIKFCFIMTRLYNRDRPAGASELLCILRTVLKLLNIALMTIQVVIHNKVPPVIRSKSERCTDDA